MLLVSGISATRSFCSFDGSKYGQHFSTSTCKNGLWCQEIWEVVANYKTVRVFSQNHTLQTTVVLATCKQTSVYLSCIASKKTSECATTLIRRWGRRQERKHAQQNIAHRPFERSKQEQMNHITLTQKRTNSKRVPSYHRVQLNPTKIASCIE